jgi:hypothetical protein
MNIEEQQAALRPALQSQLKQEIGDTEDLPFKTLNVLKQKFGLAGMTYTPIEKHWIMVEAAQ